MCFGYDAWRIPRDLTQEGDDTREFLLYTIS